MTRQIGRVLLAVSLVVGCSAMASAQSVVTMQLLPIVGPLTFDQPGAPLPLGRTISDTGSVKIGGVSIGDYLRVKTFGTVPPAAGSGQQGAALTITLFLRQAGSTTPLMITLQGGYSGVSGSQDGSISATSRELTAIVGVGFNVLSAGPGVEDLHLFFP